MSARVSLNTNLALIRLVLVAAGAVTLLFLGAFSGSANAQTEEPAPEGTESAQSDGFVPETYEYTVETGNNVTLLVRRALQLFDQAKTDIALSQAQALYCETNIVQAMGAKDLIYPGEKITVDSKSVEQFANSSQQLTAAQVAAWQVYADQADFELDNIAPTTVVVNEDGTVTEPEIEEAPSNSPTTDLTPSEDESKGTGWYWWFIGAGTVAVIWYFLWRRQDEVQA